MIREVGRVNFPKGIVTVSDPVYGRTAEGNPIMGKEVQILPGEYILQAQEDGGYVEALRIINAECVVEVTEREKIGTVGVDSGMAGFFEDKPDYTDEQFTNFANFTNQRPLQDAFVGSKENVVLCNAGFSVSGFGDGTYEIFAGRNKSGQVVELTIVFIEG